MAQLNFTKPYAVFLFLFTLVLATGLAGTALAQLTTATISGTARDETGAVVPGATMTVKNTETGFVRTLISDDEGRYRATQLPLGNYDVAIELAGFQREVRSGIKLTMDREAIVDFTLKVGEVSETVTVSSEAALIETTSSSLGGLVDDRQIRSMPLNGRSIGQLTALEVGVTISRASTSPDRSFNIGGARRYQTKILMDNSDISSAGNDMPNSVAGVFLGVEAVREFKVQVNNFSSEYGGSGGIVSAVTRSGTNAFHGSLLEFHRNSAFDARNFFNPEKDPPPFKRNQFGASFGGPIKKNKTFFFVNYEGLRDRENNFTIANVPTELAKQGILPSSRVEIHPNIRPYLALLPPPNGRDNRDGTGEYVASVKTPADDDFLLVRIDHSFSPQDSLYGRFSYDDAVKSTPNTPPIINRINTSNNKYFALEETRIVTPTLLNVFHLGYNRSTSSGPCEQIVPIPSSLDLVPGRPFGTGGGFLMSALNIGALVNCNTALTTEAFNRYEYGDNVSWNKGRHSLKFGLQVKNLRLNGSNWTEYGGVYTFTTLERFLTGRPTLFRGLYPDADGTRSWRQTLYGFFVQNDFQIKTNLTLNLGLRYELTTAPVEKFGRAARLLDVLDPKTTILGRGAYIETSKKDFAPRVGLAWDPSGNGKFSVRGGFGIFFEPLMPYSYAGNTGARTPPFYRRASINNPPFPNAIQVIQQFPFDLALITFGSYSKTPYSMQYNFNLQREVARGLVLSAAYIGSRGVHIIRVSDRNNANPVIQADGRKFFPAGSPRRNPNWSEVLFNSMDAASWYNAAGVSVRKRLSGGNQLQLSYTTGKMMDNASLKSGPEGSLNSGRQTMDPYDLNRDKSLSTHHVAHNLVVNSIYELPFGKGRRLGGNLPGFVSPIVSGWQLNGIMALASGTPFNVELGFNAARDGQQIQGTLAHQRPDLAPGKSNNPVLGGPDKYLDAGSFRVPVAGYYGNLGRNTAKGPKYANLDLGLTKNTAVGEGKDLEFRVEMFNALNHANFGVPARFVFNDASGNPPGNFGRITNTINTARQIQMGLKFTF